MSYPKKENPDKLKQQGWSYDEQVGRNQAIEDMTAELKERTELEKLKGIVAKWGMLHLHNTGFTENNVNKLIQALQDHILEGLGGKK